MKTITIENRTYELTQQPEFPNFSADLKTRGFDGTTWIGVSHPVGRQRKTYTALFFRTQNGVFVIL